MDKYPSNTESASIPTQEPTPGIMPDATFTKTVMFTAPVNMTTQHPTNEDAT